MQAAPVDFARRHHHHAHLGGTRKHRRIQLLTASGRVLLGVVQIRQRPGPSPCQLLRVEAHGGCHQRPGQTPSSGLVGPGDEARAQRPVVL